MLNYTFKRIIQMIPILIIVSIIIFFMIRLIPGDPITIRLGVKATPKMVEILMKKEGLDKPILVQYLIFIKNLLRFDMGNSIIYHIPIFVLLKKKMVVTLLLTLFTLIFSVIISWPLGYLAGIKANKIEDQIIRAGALVALSAPQFWVGLILMILFAVSINIFPVGGWGDTWPQHLRSIILPAFTQSLMTAALLTSNLRNGVVDILKMDYVDFAKSKGLEDKVIKNRHIIRNAMVPYVTLIAMRAAYMLGASIIIETVFALPGVGALMVQSIYGRDYTVIQGVVLIFSLMVVTINLLTDLAYAYLDPRVRFE